MNTSWQYMHELGKYQLFRSHLPPELAAEFDALAIADGTEPVPSARHESALAAYRKRYAIGYVDAFIARRIGTDPALLVNLVMHFAGGDETRFGLPYMAQRFGWTRRTYEAARKAARDAGVLIEREGAGFDRRLRLSVDMDVFARIEAEESRTAFNFARRKKSLAYMVRGLEIPLDDGDDDDENDAAAQGQNPVDNLEDAHNSKGFPLGGTVHLQGFPLGGNVPFEAAENAHSLEEESGIGISKSVGIPARERQPDDDDEKETGTSKPPAPAKPPVDHERAAETLMRGMAAMGLDVEPEAVRDFCAVRSVTPAEAASAITAGQQSPNRDNIGGLNYFKKVIENNRKEGKTSAAVPGSIPMAQNPALEQIKRINGEPKRVTPIGESSAAAALAAARAARDKARF